MMSIKKILSRILHINIVLLIVASTLFASVTRKPYIQVLTSNSVTIRWMSDKGYIGNVFYGTSLDSLNTELIESGERKVEHEITILNLLPNTKYYYTVEKSKYGSEEQFFVTAPKIGSKDSVRIWVIADFGQTSSASNKRREKTVSVWKEFNNNNLHSSFILSLGDQSEDDSRYQLQHNFFNQLEDVLQSTPIYTVEGNHDNKDNFINYYRIFKNPTEGEAGGVDSNSKDYYSFNYANIHVVVLSTEINDFGGGAQEAWLKQDLENNKQDWLIAAFHRPMHSGGHHKTNNNKTAELSKKYWLPILEDNGVDLILQGHNHQYERSYLLDNLTGLTTEITDENIIDDGLGREDIDGAYFKKKGKPHQGTIFIEVAPGGVASDDFTDYKIFPVFYHEENNEGSLVIDVKNNRMDVKFLCDELDSNGSHIWDYFTIIKTD